MSEGPAMQDWIAAMVRDIGPRRPGTAGEARAAERVAEELRASCDEVRIEPVATRDGIFFGLVWIMLGGYGAAFLLTFVWPGVALALASVLGASFLLNSRGRRVLDPLFPRSRSQNVIGVVRPTGERRRLVLFAGHHDSPVLMPLWRPERKRWIEHIYRGALIGFSFQVLFSLAAALGFSSFWLGLLGTVAFMGLLLTAVITWGVLGSGRPCAGANDNLSAVAVVTALARHLAGSRPRHTEVWLLSFGCEEAGCHGSRDFAARYAPELEQAVLVNMETVGSGELAIIRRERQSGRNNHPQAIALARSAARHAGLDLPVVDLSFGGTDAMPFTEEDLRAVSIFGRDRTDLFSLWHVEEDRPENLDPEVLERALLVCRSAVEVTEAEAA
jgi:hypothetical protein